MSTIPKIQESKEKAKYLLLGTITLLFVTISLIVLEFHEWLMIGVLSVCLLFLVICYYFHQKINESLAIKELHFKETLTQLEKGKEEYTNEKKYFLQTLDQSEVAMAILDHRLDIQWMNRQFEYWNGTPLASGGNFATFTRNPLQTKVFFDEFVAQKKIKDSYKTKNLQEKTFKVAIHQLNNPIGTFLVILTDISAMEERDKNRNLILALFGHDTQKYTRLSLHEVNELYEEYENNAKIKIALGELLVYVEHAFDLSKNINDWGDLVFKRDNLIQTKFISFKQQIELVRKKYAIFLNHYNIELQLIFENSLSFHADPDMLRAILRNLISNGIEAILNQTTEKKGRGNKIQVIAKKIQFQTKISISDTGIGIAPQMQPLLFNLENISEQVSLGSMLCAYFVEAHNGKIYIDDPLPDFYTTISFVIPSKKYQHQK